jgi:hypothetical protein
MMKKKFAVGTAAGLIAAGVAVAPPAYAAGWQSIYGSPSGKWGEAHGYPTRGDAQAAALGRCVQTGAAGCGEAATSQMCVALAYNSNTWHGGYGPTPQAAQNNARAINGGGDILVTEC